MIDRKGWTMSSAGDELKWLATQYVLDELSDADRDAFEMRLITDLAACEAVTAASQLLATVQVAMSSTPTVSPATGRRLASEKKSHWLVIASTAVALSMVGAAFWVSLASPEFGGSESALASSDDDFAESEVDEPDDDAPLTIPEWLIAGVSLEEPTTKDN